MVSTIESHDPITAIQTHDRLAGERETVKFQLLGPIEARTEEGRQLTLDRPKSWLFLAVLLAAEGQRVPTEELIGKVWEDPPETARNVVHSLVSDVRRSLNDTKPGAGDSMLPKHRLGYQLQVDRQHVDLHRFHDQRNRAHRHAAENDDTEAVRWYREALTQWRGVPLAGLTGRWVDNYRHTLREERHATLIACLDAELRLGHHDRVLPELVNVVNDAPTDQKAVCLLMLAYYRAGRSAEALEAYRQVRRRLKELGDQPGKELNDLQHRILTQDPSLDLPTPAPAARAGATRPPGATGSSIHQQPLHAGQDLEHAMTQRYVICVADIKDSGQISGRDQEAQRQRFYAVVARAFDAAGIEHRGAPRQDLGDGAYWLFPDSQPKEALTGPFVDHLDASLRTTAEAGDKAISMRLRVAFHLGEVAEDRYGWAGTGLTTAFRLVDAEALRITLAAAHRAPLAFVVSREWYEDLVRNDVRSIDLSSYLRVPIKNKEFDDVGWIRVPGYDVPPGLNGSAMPREGDQPDPGDTDAGDAASAGDAANDAGTTSPNGTRHDQQIVTNIVGGPVLGGEINFGIQNSLRR